MSWFVYIIQCRDKKLYTGITNNVERRIQEHNNGYGCKFTRNRCPVRLLLSQELSSREAALKREIEIKRFTRKKKLELIELSPLAVRPQG